MGARQITEVQGSKHDLADLFLHLKPVLEAAGNPGAEVIEPRIKYQTWWSQYPKERSLGKILAWRIDGGDVRFDFNSVYSHYPSRCIARGGYTNTRYLGTDGTKYQLMMSAFDRRPGVWEVASLAEIDEEDNFPIMAASYLRRLVREVAPTSAKAEWFELFGSSFQVPQESSWKSRREAAA